MIQFIRSLMGLKNTKPGTGVCTIYMYMYFKRRVDPFDLTETAGLQHY
jgi:hypothetical protein